MDNKIILSSICIDELKAEIRAAIQEVIQQNKVSNSIKPADTERWLNIDELCQYHPDKPSKNTVYSWVHAGTIPVHKGGKRLRFLKSEIDSFLLQGRKQTRAEIEAESMTERDTYLMAKRKGGKS